MSLQDDLVRWEAGEVSRDELMASWASSDKNLTEPWDENLDRTLEKNMVPRADEDGFELAVTKMLDLHERLTEIGNEPVPYGEADWEQLKAGLPDRRPRRRVFGSGRFVRPLVAASMVVGLTAGAAAASPTVRQHIVSVWHGIQHVVAPGDPGPSLSPSPTITSRNAPGYQVNGDPVRTTGNSGGNSGSPGNSDGTPGGGNSGSPGNSDGTPGGGNSGSPGNSGGTPGGGNSGGNSGSPGNSGTPGTPAPPAPPGNPGGTGTPGGPGDPGNDPGNGNGNGNDELLRLAIR